ncbi:MAG: nucleoside triphosphate pyrophosphohydrolase family protein [Defluviitaleaceae bacterium]|nr:nucleoside triphosphate pyrophosphohydrolase family protein [Defluviitaleaceae bacterium]
MQIKEFNTYQKEAIKTASKKMSPEWIAYLCLGLNGEAGEVAEIIKKHLRDGAPIDKENIKKELGDVLWYIASTCEALGFTMQEVAEKNIDKLRARHGESYSGVGDRDGEGK